MVATSTLSLTAPREIGESLSIPLDRLTTNRANRKIPKDEDLRGLATSITAVGLLYPIIVRPDPVHEGSYRIIAGERRWRALRLLKIESAPCVVVNTEGEAPNPEVLRVVENHQRRNLEPLEEAAAIRALLDSGMEVEVVARSLGRRPAWIARRSSLTDLSDHWVHLARDKESKIATWSPAHLEMISRFPPEVQDHMLDRMGNTWQMHLPTLQDLKNISGEYLRLLSSVPWKLEDDTLLPVVGACTVCPKRSSHTPELFSDEMSPANGKAAPGDHCLDPACWRDKAVVFLKRRIETLSGEYASLLLLNTTEYVNLQALKETFGREIENAWEVAIGRKSDENAVPALIVNGAGLGRIKWVLPFGDDPGPPDASKSHSVDGEGEKQDRTPAQKKEPYDKRRRQFVIDLVREKIQAVASQKDLQGKPPAEGREALTSRGLLGKTLYFLSAMLNEHGWRSSIHEGSFDPPEYLAWSDLQDIKNHEIGMGQMRDTFLSVCWDLLSMALGRYSLRLLVGSGERTNDRHYADAETICAMLGFDLTQLRAQAAETIPYAKYWRDEVQDEWVPSQSDKAANANPAESATRQETDDTVCASA